MFKQDEWDGASRQPPSDEDAREITSFSGKATVHSSSATYKIMADSLENDAGNPPQSRYANPTRSDTAPSVVMWPRMDFSMDRARGQ